MRSQVAGVSITNSSLFPASLLAALTASTMAKNTDAARNKGGSPTAYGSDFINAVQTPFLQPTLEEKIASGFGALPSRATRKSRGMSWHEGILYVPGPVVNA